MDRSTSPRSRKQSFGQPDRGQQTCSRHGRRQNGRPRRVAELRRRRRKTMNTCSEVFTIRCEETVFLPDLPSGSAEHFMRGKVAPVPYKPNRTDGFAHEGGCFLFNDLTHEVTRMDNRRLSVRSVRVADDAPVIHAAKPRPDLNADHAADRDGYVEEMHDHAKRISGTARRELQDVALPARIRGRELQGVALPFPGPLPFDEAHVTDSRAPRCHPSMLSQTPGRCVAV